MLRPKRKNIIKFNRRKEGRKDNNNNSSYRKIKRNLNDDDVD